MGPVPLALAGLAEVPLHKVLVGEVRPLAQLHILELHGHASALRLLLQALTHADLVGPGEPVQEVEGALPQEVCPLGRCRAERWPDGQSRLPSSL